MIQELIAKLRGYGWKDASTGRFVSRAYAERNESTTYHISFWRKP